MPIVSSVPWIYDAHLQQANDPVALSKIEAWHVAHVLRCKTNAMVTAFDGFGHTRSGQLHVQQSAAHVHFTEPLQMQPLQPVVYQLVLFLPNHVATFESILKKLCELGIDTLRPVLGDRTERQRWTPSIWQKHMERWQRILVEACKQAKNPFLPTLQSPIEMQQLASMDLGVCFHGTLNGTAISALQLNLNTGTRISASDPHMDSSDVNLASTQSIRTRLSAIIGPEGGFSTTEIQQLAAFSQAIRLPTHVLRVETAVVSLLAVLKWCAIKECHESSRPPLVHFETTNASRCQEQAL